MPLPRPVRRLLLPGILAGEAVLLVLLALTAVVGVLTAPVDRHLRLLRLAVMGASYVCIQWTALAWLLWAWVLRPLRGGDWWDRTNVEVLGWALGGVLWMARRTVGLAVEIDAAARPAPFDGQDPVLVLARHGGIGDSFVLVWMLVTRHHRRPRVVLKQILLWEPLIDVTLSRIGACFLPPSRDRPGGDDTASGPRGRLDAQVAALAASLVEGDALLLFPEGGNWTPRRRIRAIGRLWASRKPTAARAAVLMDHVLPPRAGGVLACLDSRPEIPVAIVAHTGLDRITTAGQMWDAVPFDVPMSLRWWPAASPPYGREERVEWLTTEWAVVDQWIDSRSGVVDDPPADVPPGSGSPLSGTGR